MAPEGTSESCIGCFAANMGPMGRRLAARHLSDADMMIAALPAAGEGAQCTKEELGGMIAAMDSGEGDDDSTRRKLEAHTDDPEGDDDDDDDQAMAILGACLAYTDEQMATVETLAAAMEGGDTETD